MQDIIEFTESLGINLEIGQRIFLKLAYGLEFDDSDIYPVEDPFKFYEPRQMTEKQLFKHLSEDNIKFGEKDRRFVSAVCGRRSGKTLLGALAMGYELKKFLKNPNPCESNKMVNGTKFYFLFLAPTQDSAAHGLDIFNTLIARDSFLNSRICFKTIYEISFKTDEDIEKGRDGTVIVMSGSFGSSSTRGKNVYMAIAEEIEFGFDFKKTFQSVSPSLFGFKENLSFTFSSKANYSNPMTSYCKPRFIFNGYTTLMNPRCLQKSDIKHMIQNDCCNFIREFCV